MKIAEVTPHHGLVFRIENVGYSHGQSDRILIAYRGRTPVGQIEYSDYHGEPAVKMIHVPDQFRRQGIGTSLVRRLQTEYPGVEIDMGIMTDDGHALLGSIPQRVIGNPEHDRLAARLAQLQQKEQSYQAMADRFYASPTPEGREELHRLTDTWNALNDQIYELEKQLQDVRGSARVYEATMDNMQVLNDCVELVIKSLPYRFRADQTFGIQGFDLNGLKNLAAKYKGTVFEETIHKIGTVAFVFMNSKNTVRSGTLGSYSYNRNGTSKLLVNVSGFIQAARPVTLQELLTIRRDDIPLRTFRAIILHELRHVFQSHAYPGYFQGDGSSDDVSYKKQPVELDAWWMHHLEDFDPNKYPTAVAYADAVMGSFAGHMKLSPAYQDHYRKKTIRYWAERKRGVGKDALAMPAQQRREMQSVDIRGSIVAAANRISGGSYDLRQLRGYATEATRFILPRQAITATAAMIEQNKQIPVQSAPVAFLVLSLVVTPQMVPQVLRHLRFVQKIRPRDALEYLDAAFGPGWDSETIKRHIASVFGTS